MKKDCRLFVGSKIVSASKKTSRKPALVTFVVDDEFAEKAIRHCMSLERFSLKDPVFLGLNLVWREEV